MKFLPSIYHPYSIGPQSNASVTQLKSCFLLGGGTKEIGTQGSEAEEQGVIGVGAGAEVRTAPARLAEAPLVP